MLGIVMGFFAAISTDTSKRRTVYIFAGWALAVVFHGAYDFPIFAMESEQTPKNVAFGLYGLFMFVILLLGAVGFRFLKKLFPPAETTTVDPKHRFDRILNRGATWIVCGGVMATSGVALVALSPVLFDDESRWLAFPFTLYPAFFAISMYRFARRLPPTGAT